MAIGLTALDLLGAFKMKEEQNWRFGGGDKYTFFNGCGHGYGYGYGDGGGYDDGDGYGGADGYGDGEGYCNGAGEGSGYGHCGRGYTFAWSMADEGRKVKSKRNSPFHHGSRTWKFWSRVWRWLSIRQR